MVGDDTLQVVWEGNYILAMCDKLFTLGNLRRVRVALQVPLSTYWWITESMWEFATVFGRNVINLKKYGARLQFPAQPIPSHLLGEYSSTLRTRLDTATSHRDRMVALECNCYGGMGRRKYHGEFVFETDQTKYNFGYVERIWTFGFH
jgi:hypothetical protein